MAEQIKDLIEKIQQEGFRAAEDKAKEIERLARREADEIIEKAELESARTIAEAKGRITQMESSVHGSLKQAGRDLLLSLRGEINAMLDKLIRQRLQESLGPQEIVKIVNRMIGDYGRHNKTDAVVSLNKEDLERIEKGFLGELKEEIKKGVTLKVSDEIFGGFTISYDSGKSYFDFTDHALVDYIGQYLKPKLNALLNEAVSKDG